MAIPNVPLTPLQTLQGDPKIPRKVHEALKDLHATVTSLKTQIAGIQTVVATPPKTVTVDQLNQIATALSSGGSHTLFASQAIARIPTKDPHVKGELWNDQGTYIASQG
jgi:hypothetical protein